jgi:predicted transcriptional regulator
MTDEQAERVIKELEMLRKLKILELFEMGYSQGELAQVLGVSQPTISRMVPKLPSRRRGGIDE